MHSYYKQINWPLSSYMCVDFSLSAISPHSQCSHSLASLFTHHSSLSLLPCNFIPTPYHSPLTLHPSPSSLTLTPHFHLHSSLSSHTLTSTPHSHPTLSPSLLTLSCASSPRDMAMSNRDRAPAHFSNASALDITYGDHSKLRAMHAHSLAHNTCFLVHVCNVHY